MGSRRDTNETVNKLLACKLDFKLKYFFFATNSHLRVNIDQEFIFLFQSILQSFYCIPRTLVNRKLTQWSKLNFQRCNLESVANHFSFLNVCVYV